MLVIIITIILSPFCLLSLYYLFKRNIKRIISEFFVFSCGMGLMEDWGAQLLKGVVFESLIQRNFDIWKSVFDCLLIFIDSKEYK